MQVESIAECSKGSILQYFRPSLSYHFVIKIFFCLFLSGHLRQVLLYLFAYLCISVVFPQDLIQNGLAANNFAMLGLGDIVIPGIFIALLLRFDLRYVVLLC